MFPLIESAAETVALMQEVFDKLAPKEARDGRTVYVRTTARPEGLPLTAQTGGRLFTVHPLGLLVYLLEPQVVFIPYGTITEIYATSLPSEDDEL